MVKDKKYEVYDMEEPDQKKFWLIIGICMAIIIAAFWMKDSSVRSDLDKTNETIFANYTVVNTTVINNVFLNETFVNVSVYPQYNITIEKDKIWVHLYQNCGSLSLTNDTIYQQNSTNVTQNMTNGTQSNTTFTQNNTNTYNNATVYVCEEDKGHKNQSKKNKKD